MAAMYKHFTALKLLLMFVLLTEINGLVGAAKEHFHRKYLTDNGKFRYHRESTTKQNKSNRNYIEPKKLQNQTLNKLNDNIETVTAQAGSRAILHCDITKLGDVGKINTTVIWIRKYNDSFTILTDGDKVVTDDKRIFATNKTNAKDWTLHIRYTQFSDEGLYQCQMCSISTPSTFSIFVKLELIQARAIIIGAPKKEVEKVGSPLRLSCVLNNSIEAPAYIFWYHGDRMINYDLNDGATVRDGRQGSELIFPRAQRKHAGNYSCVPSNALQADIEVEILSSETSNANNANESHA